MQKTIFLLGMLTAFFMLIGYLIGGVLGSIIALAFACIMNITAYWHSDKMVLKIAGVEEANPQNFSNYYQIIKELTTKAQLPMPMLYIINSNVPNAFATGRDHNHASIAVNTGLLSILSNNELSGVLAHEIAHIKHRDILISTITATFAGAIGMISSIFMFNAMFGGMRNNNNNGSGIIGILLMILAPIIASIVQLAISRDREYNADNYGGKLCGNPLWLASALTKLEQSSSNQRSSNNAETANKGKALAHLYIINPFSSGGDNLFSTHPSTSNRIKALKSLATTMNIVEDNSSQPNNSLQTVKLEQTTNYSDKDVPNNPWI